MKTLRDQEEVEEVELRRFQRRKNWRKRTKKMLQL
jgi:hypothetical protein